jgi:hypothetical protein
MQQPSEEATTEQRARAVQHWTDVVRPQMAAKEHAKTPEDPHAALARLKAEASKPVVIGAELAKILFRMKLDRAA